MSRLSGLLFKVDDLHHAELLGLRAADHHKNEFMATIAHELRNSLLALLCAGELISKTALADGPLAAAAVIYGGTMLARSGGRGHGSTFELELPLFLMHKLRTRECLL